MSQKPEVWMRGPVEGIPELLQPVAHALLQTFEETEVIMRNFPNSKLWDRPSGVASVGFHLQHMCGVLDRMFTYAQGKGLDEAQFKYLNGEGRQSNVTAAELVHVLAMQVQKSVDILRHVDESSLLEPRGIGRKQIPTTVLGLLFHAAEHLQRHVGQLLVTAKILTATS